MRKWFFVLLSVISVNAYSITECQVNIDRMYVGDGGSLYIFFEGGGSAAIPQSDVNQKNALSVALSAFMANKKIIVRYNSDGISCTTDLVSDFRGLWILKN